jgi:hypothetical protein
MNIRLSKVSAAALLAIVLSLNIAPAAYAARRNDNEFGSVRDRIVRFIRDIRGFLAHPLEELTKPGS